MAREYENVEIPKPPREAFNKNRPAGLLLLAQVQHLRHGLAKHLERVAALLAKDVNRIKTEGDVSEYCREVMAVLHPPSVKRRKQRSLYATTSSSSDSSRDRRPVARPK
jgi:hypothetical protein